MNCNSPTDKLYFRLFRYDDRDNRKDSDGKADLCHLTRLIIAASTLPRKTPFFVKGV